MKKTPAAFAECAACGKPIRHGHAYVTILRHIEQLDLTPQQPDGEVTVIDARELLTLCGGCGNRFNAERATAALQAGLAQPQFAHN